MSSLNDVAIASHDQYFNVAMATYSCDHCHRLLLAYLKIARNESVNHVHATHAIRYKQLTWLPRGTESKGFADVPKHIAAAASEAYECFSINGYRAAVLLARSVIEATAKEKGITSGLLAKKIDQMYEQHLIREHVRDEAHEIRYLGNDMAHGDFIEAIESDDAEAVLVLMAEILEEVFQSPAVVARLREKRLAKKDGGQPSA